MLKSELPEKYRLEDPTQCCFPAYHRIEDGTLCQDVVLKVGNMAMVLDGCSAAVNSREGAKKFVRKYKKLVLHSGINTFDKFEENLKRVFDSLVEDAKKFNETEEDLDNYIAETFMFTIVVCFKEENQYKVKIFGDGCIYRLGKDGKLCTVSPKFPFNMPPFYAYTYMSIYSNMATYYSHSTVSNIYEANQLEGLLISTDGMDHITDYFGQEQVVKMIREKSVESLAELYYKKRKFFMDDTSCIVI